MKRRGFRFQFGLWTAWTVLQMISVVVRLATPNVWDLGGYVSLVGLLLGIVSLIFLLYVRHHDGYFWDEEAAEQDDWERRGRAL